MDRTRALLAVTLSLALVGAGCLGTGSDETTNEEEGEITPSASSEEGSNASTRQASSSPEDNGSEASAPPTETRTVAIEGQLGVEAYACSLVGCVGTFSCVASACAGAQDPRVDRFFEIEHEGPVEAVDLTLTWDATSPVTEELRFGVTWDCDREGCDFEMVDGTSPLELNETSVDAEDELYVWVWTPDQTGEGDPVYLGATHDQPFTIEGDVLVQLS